MFRKLLNAIDNLIAALNRWADAANRHADELEEQVSEIRPTAAAEAAARAKGKK